MNNVVFSFNPPTPDGSLANARTASFLSDALDLPLICDGRIADVEPDILFLVAGVFLYCKVLPQVGEAVKKAKRVIWVQNDYTIKPPKDEGGAESPFRYAFRYRKMEGMTPVDYWTTMGKLAASTDASAYLNWNSMAYEHHEDGHPNLTRPRIQDVFYYGADREHRRQYFDKFFLNPKVPITISSFSKSMTRYGENTDVIQAFKRSDFYERLSYYAMGLYLEDDTSHKQFTSPATRFYEMLSVGQAMVFQPEAVPMLARAGYNVGAYTCTPDTLPDLLSRAADIAAEQRAQWASTSHVGLLRTAVVNEYARLKELVCK